MYESRIYSLTGTLCANALCDLADPYNATINVCVKLCHRFRKRRAGVLFYTNRSAQYYVCSTALGGVRVQIMDDSGAPKNVVFSFLI